MTVERKYGIGTALVLIIIYISAFAV